ncbi:MAG: outer membrane protein assembly factor BamA [Neisseriaceae bacterium]
MNKKLTVIGLASLLLSTSAIAGDFIIKDIRVEGLQRIEADTVFDYLPIHVGEKFTSTKGEQIIKDLYATGYFQDVQVEVQGQQVLLTVVERPIVDTVSVSGGKVISNQLIKENLGRLGIKEAKVYDPAVLKAVVEGLQQEYVNFGKNNAKVDLKVDPLERNRVAVRLNIDEGITTKIRNFVFEGNKSFSGRVLRRHMSLSKHNLLSFLTKDDIYAQSKSEEDKKALVRFYKDKGFYDFKLLSMQPIVNEKDPKNLTIKVVMEEGTRFKWGKIRVSGETKEVPIARLQKIADGHGQRFAFALSKWFDQSQLDRVLSDIKFELGKRGYAKADLQVNPIRNPDGALDFDIVVAANKKIYVRQINIKGNTRTRDEVIRRETRQQENAPYNIEKINRSKDRVGELGYFEDLKVEENAVAGSDDEIDLGVKLKETNAGLFNFRVGYVQDDGVVVAGDFKHDNLWGTGRQVAASVSTGGTSKSLSLDYLNPYFTKHGIGLGFDFSALKFDPNDIETSSYKEKTFTGGTRLVVPVSDWDKVNIRLSAQHRRIDLYERSPIYYKDYIKNHGHSSNIFPLSISWKRSTVDDYMWPTRGYILDSQFEATLPHISDHQYYKLTHQEWWFLPLTDNLTFMLTGQLGYIKNYGKSKDVPFFYNFHTGGMGSLRGYDASSLGPKINNWYGDVDYLGGTKLVSGTAELFFPMPGLKNSRSVRLSLFADAASLWDGKTRGPIDNFEYPEKYKSSFKNELRYSTGLGVVWFSPLGALRFSWAKPLNKKPGDRQQSFQFNIGNTF